MDSEAREDDLEDLINQILTQEFKKRFGTHIGKVEIITDPDVPPVKVFYNNSYKSSFGLLTPLSDVKKEIMDSEV